MKYEVTIRVQIDGDDESAVGVHVLDILKPLFGGKVSVLDVCESEDSGERLAEALKELGFGLESTGGGCQAWRLDVGEYFVCLTEKEGSNARDLRADDTLWLGYFEKNQDHSDEMFVREGDWSKIQTMIREFKSGEWLTKRQSGQLKTFTEFTNERQFVTKDKDWCDEWAMGKQTQKVVEYAGGGFIYVIDDGQYLLTIGSEESISPSLALLEFDLYNKWYLNEIAA